MAPLPPSRVHIIGLPGSGKTTLASRIAARLDVQAVDLDYVVYSPEGERAWPDIVERIDRIRAAPRWVTEGAYRDPWLTPLLTGSDSIIWLDLPRLTCGVRMLKRHLVAELRRQNPHPGWRRLAAFVMYTWKSAGRQRAETALLLAPHGPKVTVCRSGAEAAKQA